MPRLLKNLQVKILAFVSALFLWAFVVSIQNYVAILPQEVPVTAINLAGNTSLSAVLPSVKLQIKSAQNDTIALRPEDFEATVDMKDLPIGVHNLKVEVRAKNPNVTVIGTIPEQIQVHLEGVTAKELPVDYTIEGKPAANYVVKDVSFNKAKIKVEAAESILQKIDKVFVKIKFKGDEKADFSKTLSPEIDASLGVDRNAISFEPDQVQATVNIVALNDDSSSASLPNNTTTNNNTSTNTNGAAISVVRKNIMVAVKFGTDIPESSVREVLPQNILVTVEGPENEINSLNSDKINFVLKGSRLENGGIYRVNTADIQLPSNTMKIIEFSPEKLQIKF